MILCLLQKLQIFVMLLIIIAQVQLSHAQKIIYAVNCGGDTHTDIYGVRYERDPLHDSISGTASNYGKRFVIGRVPPEDQILYQTERYHTDTFWYELPTVADGHYVLVLKFSEVYFEERGQKVFDVVLNQEHQVVDQLDIYAHVGKGVAHDEYVAFSVADGRLYYNDEVSPVDANSKSIRLAFIKGEQDNPKINAFYVVEGQLEDVPKLPSLVDDAEKNGDYFEDGRRSASVSSFDSLEEEDEEEGGDNDINVENARPYIQTGAANVEDPYLLDDSSSMMLPIFIAIGAFIPLLFCLCKL